MSRRLMKQVAEIVSVCWPPPMGLHCRCTQCAPGQIDGGARGVGLIKEYARVTDSIASTIAIGCPLDIILAAAVRWKTK